MTVRNIDRTGAPTDLLTTEEAAALLGVTVRYLAVRRSSGAIPLAPVLTRKSRHFYARQDVWAAVDSMNAARQTGRCDIPECPLRGRASRDGLCVEHRNLALVAGSRDGLHGRPPARPASTHVVGLLSARTRLGSGDGCDFWCGARSSSGYGKLYAQGRTRPAHVVAFELATGRSVRDGYEIDHECENALCVRVGAGHVIEATHAENIARQTASYWARKAAAQAASVVQLFPVVQDDELDQAA